MRESRQEGNVEGGTGNHLLVTTVMDLTRILLPDLANDQWLSLIGSPLAQPTGNKMKRGHIHCDPGNHGDRHLTASNLIDSLAEQIALDLEATQCCCILQKKVANCITFPSF